MEQSLYAELADWWPLLSAPEEYVEEAAFYGGVLREALEGDGQVADGARRQIERAAPTLLELGSGGGNNASHLKLDFRMTLVDLSPGMLAVSRALNPECEHLVGDMRTVRVGRQFDAVFIQDAIAHMATREDLAAAITTAYVHCRPGGVALFAPDYVQETFRPSTAHGGTDAGGRGLRYLEWVWDPDPHDSTYVTAMAYLLREEDGSTRAVHERFVEGLFPRSGWLSLLRQAGFEARLLPFAHSEYEGQLEVFVGRRPQVHRPSPGRQA